MYDDFSGRLQAEDRESRAKNLAAAFLPQESGTQAPIGQQNFRDMNLQR
jgi:hypothetical protein